MHVVMFTPCGWCTPMSHIHFSSDISFDAMPFAKLWVNGAWEIPPDFRNYAERHRVRHRVRAPCPVCAEQGLLGKAQLFTWCKGFCYKHAKGQGLLEPKKKKLVQEPQVKMKKKQNVTKKVKKAKQNKKKPGVKQKEKKKVPQNYASDHKQKMNPQIEVKKEPDVLMKGNEEKMEDGEDACKNGERNTNGSRKVVKHGQANSRKAVEKKVKGVEMKAKKKKKPMHENRYPGGWSDAVMTTGHHISQVE